MQWNLIVGWASHWKLWTSPRRLFCTECLAQMCHDVSIYTIYIYIHIYIYKDIHIIIYIYIYIHINKLWNSRRFSRQSEQWNLKSCPKALLRVDPEKRMTAAEALQHPWLKANLGQLDWTNFALYSKYDQTSTSVHFYTDTIHLHMVVRTQLLLPTNQGVDNSKDWSSITLGQKQRSKKPPTGIHWIRVCPYLFSFGFAGFCPTGSSLDALSYCMLETFRDRLVALRAMMRAKFRFRVAVWCSLMHSVSFCVLWGQGCVSFDLGGDRSICRTDSFAEMFSKIATKRHFVGTG